MNAKLAPCDCRAQEDAMRLQRDNLTVGCCEIQLDDSNVMLAFKKEGTENEQGDCEYDSVEMPIPDFNKLVTWWMRKQRARKTKTERN